jgi:1,4-dihydroxy-2-naphthoate octaprenyltransferase
MSQEASQIPAAGIEGAKAPPSKAKVWLLELRAPFFTAAVFPVLTAAGYIFWKEDVFNLALVLITVAGTICLHAGTNMINDYFDFKSGDDPRNKARTIFNGGAPFLVLGLLKPKSVLIASLIAFALGGLIGIYLALTVSLWVLPIGIVGGLFGLLYVAPKINLAGRGVGEIAVGLGFGPLMTMGACVVFNLSGVPDMLQFIIGLPIGFLITLVLYINQFPDMEADASVGKNHWVVRLGRKKARAGYPVILGLSYVSVVLFVLIGWMPIYALIYLLTIPLAVKASKTVLTKYEELPVLVQAQAQTIMMHLLCGLLITIGFVLAAFFPIVF